MVETPLALWAGFIGFILVLLALDLGVFHKEQRAIPVKEALLTCLAYIALAMVFNAGVWYFRGEQQALEFLTGYFIEYALSMDNIMVFVLILAHFRVPAEYQFRVLVWGILGALVLRGIFIAAGAALISAFHWIILVFGVFLIFTGLKTLFAGEEHPDLEENRIVKLSRRLFPVTDEYDGEKFFTVKNGIRYATPLFLVLIVLNLTDILFAVDSIPAIFAITQDPFIVFTSNVFAILGLRALYFALAGALDKFHLLRHGISLVLVAIGIKMVANYLEDEGYINLLASGDKLIPTEWALALTVVLIFGSVIASLIFPPKDPALTASHPSDPQADVLPGGVTTREAAEAKASISDVSRGDGETYAEGQRPPLHTPKPRPEGA